MVHFHVIVHSCNILLLTNSMQLQKCGPTDLSVMVGEGQPGPLSLSDGVF